MGSLIPMLYHEELDRRMYLALPQHPGELDLVAAIRILRIMGFSEYDHVCNQWTRKAVERSDIVNYETQKFYHPRNKVYHLSATCWPQTEANRETFVNELTANGFEIVKPFGETPPSRTVYD